MGFSGEEKKTLVTDQRRAVKRAEDICIQKTVNNDVEEWTWIVRGSVSKKHRLLLSSEKRLKTLAISHLVIFEPSGWELTFRNDGSAAEPKFLACLIVPCGHRKPASTGVHCLIFTQAKDSDADSSSYSISKRYRVKELVNTLLPPCHPLGNQHGQQV